MPAWTKNVILVARVLCCLALALGGVQRLRSAETASPEQPDAPRPQVSRWPQAVPPPEPVPEPGHARENCLLAGVILCAAFIIYKLRRRDADFFKGIFDPQPPQAPLEEPKPEPESPLEAAARALSEEPDFLAFIAALKAGPGGAGSDALGGASKPAPGALKPAPAEPVFNSGREQIAALRALVTKIGRSPEGAVRQAVLAETITLVGAVKANSREPELLPVWQLAFALEGLLGQLANHPSEVTPSRLRTVANTLDLFDLLWVSKPSPELASEPPVRVLAVDDDAVSRFALSAALNRAFGPADLAAGSRVALDLATRHAYDAIFLDIEMPVMDGFELCARIRQATLNRTTPIVFVTSHSGFESRAISAAVGGHELIAKPFFAFEVALKALTLVLKGRIERAGQSRVRENLPDGSRIAPSQPPASTIEREARVSGIVDGICPATSIRG